VPVGLSMMAWNGMVHINVVSGHIHMISEVALELAEIKRRTMA